MQFPEHGLHLIEFPMIKSRRGYPWGRGGSVSHPSARLAALKDYIEIAGNMFDKTGSASGPPVRDEAAALPHRLHPGLESSYKRRLITLAENAFAISIKGRERIAKEAPVIA